ncbi:MAG: tRNA uridine(34) 5-carboxymethylaminomethyl modification radical SAM/GNAT enzyme Elp3 [Thermoplasmata archaeon]|nr:tRNA uridine(34) 5-carboxymethylaminomethyl modification radical SAM/GNAT enzyme Elp3 [Thermoplasmata archaeon]
MAWEAAQRGGEAPSPGRILRKPTRTLSGVAVVAVMTAPSPCPHGRCTYCPGGVELGSPQSYTGEEPSALRGAQFGFDPWSIVTHRLESLESIGHPTSKVEAIVMGGTFPSRPRRYQESVFRGIYDGLNGVRSTTLAEAQERNETAERRLVGLTVETRPDWCDGRVLPDLLDAGVTRVELGVECLDEAVLAAVGRAHGANDVVHATREARDRGLKIGYHLMLGLPGMDPEKDEAGFRRLFEEPEYRPDFLKIYPTLVLPSTPLYDQWRRGEYKPYDTETAVELLARLKAHIPPWVRVHRIQRDIPVRLIAAGVRASNIRQLALARLESKGGRCRCLRCREVGRRAAPPLSEFVPREVEYAAGGGTERFLSLEEPVTEAVAGYLRLRFPSDRTSGGLEAPVIRELKVLGTEVPIGRAAAATADYQHRGIGRALVARAEEAARSSGASRIYVRSAVGTREYYRRLGYTTSGPQMAKPLCAG